MTGHIRAKISFVSVPDARGFASEFGPGGDGFRQRPVSVGQGLADLLQTHRGIGVPRRGGHAGDVEPGFPVVLVDGRGQVSADMQAIGRRLTEQSCRLIWLLDGISDHGAPGETVSLDSGLPEELTPLTLAVLGQLLAHRVAVARGIDPDRPRALNKVTRTW